MSGTSPVVRFFYGTCLGRIVLQTIMRLHLDRPVVSFLRSNLSKPLVVPCSRRFGLDLPREQLAEFDSYRDFFARTRETDFDPRPGHLISPCDGWLSVFTVDEQSAFTIKNSHYRLCDFLRDEELAANYRGGMCLIFRLGLSDYHHYCYIDDGYQGNNYAIPGVLHSVQPIACETHPVFVLNRRSWCLLTTEHFGPVVQCEIGALVVGGIFNEKENTRFVKGSEKGHFELAGSTIVLLIEKGKVQLRPEVLQGLSQQPEVRVTLGQWIGTAETTASPEE